MIGLLIPCRLSQGLRDEEALVTIQDFHGNSEAMPLDRAFVVYVGKTAFLPVRVLHLHEQDKAALIALPVESDSGAHRIWVKLEGARQLEDARA
jgi:hypothetical protein